MRVLDLTRVVSGPWSTQILADLGADVIKIERPGEGDDTRRLGPFVKNADGTDSDDSVFFLACNRGKRSVTVDIAKPEGADLVRSLARRCDIFIQNFKAGGLKSYGLDDESIRALNPSIIYCSITGFGQDGPYAPRPAYDFIVQGLSGLMSTCGLPDGEPGGQPMRTAIPLVDQITGLYAACSMLGALYHRRATGEGQFIDAVMLDAAVALNGHLALGYLMTGNPPPRVGNSNPVAAPSGVYRTADGHMIVAAGNGGQYASLLAALNRPDLGKDPRFQTNMLRVTNRPALDEQIAAEIVKRSTGEWIAIFEKAGVPSGPINDMRQAFDDPQVKLRGLHKELPHPRGGTVPTLRSPMTLSGSPVDYRTPPMLGQHTDEVLTELLGLDRGRLTRLREQGVI